jgi:hypothetical protein
VIEMIEFSPSEWPEQSATPGHLLAFLRELRRNDLRRFLRLATSQCTITRELSCWVTLRARWVTLRARWVTLRARWVTLRARWVTLRARRVTFTGGVRMPVTIHRCPLSDRLPVGRTCFRRVDLPGAAHPFAF